MQVPGEGVDMRPMDIHIVDIGGRAKVDDRTVISDDSSRADVGQGPFVALENGPSPQGFGLWRQSYSSILRLVV